MIKSKKKMPNPMLIPAIIGGLGAVGNMVTGIGDSQRAAETSRYNTDRTIQAQKFFADQAYQRSVADWHRQNAYNTPAEQMKRFGAAGLNPHLIYGQGSTGNAGGIAPYQAPRIQYQYEAPAYSGAVGSMLPTLMEVGSWIQNMKLSEAEVRNKQVGLTKAEQMVEYLRARYPREIAQLDNKLELFPYQKSMQGSLAERAFWSAQDLYSEYKYKFGDDGKSGLRGLQFLEQSAKSKLASAKASWTDMGFTDPQAIMQMVLGSVLSMAGMSVRSMSNVRRPKITETETIKRVGRTRTVKRERYQTRD